MDRIIRLVEIVAFVAVCWALGLISSNAIATLVAATSGRMLQWPAMIHHYGAWYCVAGACLGLLYRDFKPGGADR